jgi:hypothetical protein
MDSSADAQNYFMNPEDAQKAEDDLNELVQCET